MNHFVYFSKTTLDQSPLQILTSLILLLLFTTSSLTAGNYTWNGTTNSDWANSSNWSPSGIPNSNDTITINSGKPNLELDQDRTVNRLIQYGSTIDLDTNELHVTQRASFNGGDVIGASLKLRGTYAYFQGTDFNCTLDVIVGQIKFSGGTFDQNGSFEQNGSASGWGDGGCVFNADVTIKNSGTAYLRMGEDFGDTFNGKVYLISSGGYAIQMAFGDTSYFNDTIYINSNANGGVYFCNATSGAMALLGDNACLVTGSTGISAGTIQFKNIFQTATTANSITASGSVLFNVFVNTFGGKVNFTAPNLIVKTSTFNDSTFLTKTGSTLNNTWEGNNTYNAVVTITNGNTLTAYLKLASQSADVYNEDVYFNAGTGPIQTSNAGTNIYNGNVAVNGNNVTFNNSGGTLKFAGSEDQEFGGGTSTLTFNKLIVDKPGGIVTLNQPITIDSLLQLSNGIVYTDTLITLKATATTTGANNLSYVDGTVKKIGNTAFIFPVGADNSYYPIEISAPAVSTESFTAKYFAIHHSLSDSCDTTVSSISTCNYWQLKRNTGSTNVQVRLYWDSLGCGLFDTSGIHILNWNGVKWKDLGASGISGNARVGSIGTSVTVAQFDFFTLGISLPVINVNPTLGDDRDLPIDFFGFNGGNTIQVDANDDPVQTWEILYNNEVVLANPAATILRVPFGTLSNFADWRTGWPILERDLPFDWFYDKNSFKKIPTSYLGNTYDFYRNNLELLGAQAMITWNMLSSKFYYELASIYRLQELNVPIRYLELGNEFYLNDEYNKQVFPSANSYVDLSLEYATSFRDFQLPQTTQTKIAMVGADIPQSGPGRRRLWLESALKRLPNTNNIDAIVIHDYIGEFPINPQLCQGSFISADLQTYIEKAFIEEDYLKANTFDLIDDYNSAKFSAKPLEIWLTEFNMLDNNNFRIGTWSHGLFNSVMALKYLETEAITKVISHTLTSDGIYGNIFESSTGFDDIQCHGAPHLPKPKPATVQWGLTAVGNAFSLISQAMKNAEKAWPLDFSAIQPPLQTLVPNSTNPLLYGWVFERGSNDREVILLNLGGTQSYNLELENIYSGIYSTSSLEYEQLTAISQNYAITGNAVEGATDNGNLNLTIGIASIMNGSIRYVEIPPFSLTRIFLVAPPLQVRLTDDEICSESSTTLIIEGGSGSYTVACSVSGLTITPVNNSDHIWKIQTSPVNSTTIYPISVNGNVVCTLNVHQDLIDLQIVDGNNNPITSPITYCPSSGSETLTATFNPVNGSMGSLGDYHFLWAPDSGMISNACSTNVPMCNSIQVDPQRTTIYTVYVTNDQCWKSASVTVEVPIEPFDLGEDITVCAGTPLEITANYIDKEISITLPAEFTGTNDIYNPTLTIPTQNPGTSSYTITVTDFNFGITCSTDDIITVNVLECCSISSGAISLIPQQFGTRYISHETVLQSTIFGVCSTCVINAPGEITLDGSFTNEDIFIDGEFVLRSGTANPNNYILKNWTIHLGDNASLSIDPDRKLTLENCTLVSCGNKMWNSIILDKEGSKFIPSIEIKDCIIRDAKTGLTLTREANYTVTGNTFENCHIDIDMSNYQSKAKGKIEDNIFTSSGLLTLYPHVSDKKYAGIVLNDVEEIEIGDAADPNTFSHSLFGIHSTNSSLNLFNNSFEDIWDNSTSPTQGTAVHVVSDFDQNDRVLKVGNGTPTKGNTFLRSLNGIFTDGEMNIDIKKNIFGSSSSDVDRLRVHGIGIRNPGYKSVVIENGNEFYDYNYGVWTENDRNYNVLYIHNNDFFNHFDYSEFLGGNTAYYGSAITALSYIPITVSNAEISLNTIGSSDPNDFEQSRIGIRVANLKRFRILANHIFFNHAAVPGNVFTGITLQNCKDARLNLNEVVNVNTLFPSGSKNTLVGLRIHDSNNTCIENSTLSGLGFSMMFHGNSVVNSLYTNTMTNFDTSICLVTANIGATQGSSTNVLNNRWFRNNMNNNTTGRVAGSTHNGGQIVWYHQGIVNSSDEFIPYSAGGIVTSFQISNYSTLSSCPANFVFGEQDDPPYTATTRNSNYGYIVGDSGRFDEEYFHEYRYLSRGELYLTLKNNPELLSMDDTADDSFVGFYADMSGSNYQHFDSVFALIESGDLLTAESIVLAIDDTNDIEYNMKTVLQILLHSLIVDSAFSASDSTLLIEIAYRNPLTGGNGVFIARHLLNLEIYDEEESGSRIASFNQKKNEKKFIEVYPVPSKVGVYIKPTGDFIPDGLELFGINGELVYKATFKNYLNIDFLKAGIYLVRVFSGNEFRHAKIVKLP